MLDYLRKAMGVPLRISRGYSCECHIRSLTDADRSLHLEGRAFDIAIARTDPNRDLLILKASEIGFTGFGSYPDHLHIDTGKRRYWKQ